MYGTRWRARSSSRSRAERSREENALLRRNARAPLVVGAQPSLPTRGAVSIANRDRVADRSAHRVRQRPVLVERRAEELRGRVERGEHLAVPVRAARAEREAARGHPEAEEHRTGVDVAATGPLSGRVLHHPAEAEHGTKLGLLERAEERARGQLVGEREEVRGERGTGRAGGVARRGFGDGDGLEKETGRGLDAVPVQRLDPTAQRRGRRLVRRPRVERERGERGRVVDRVDLAGIGLHEARRRGHDPALERPRDRLLSLGESRRRSQYSVERERDAGVSEIRDVPAVGGGARRSVERRERVVVPRLVIEGADPRLEHRVEAPLHTRDALVTRIRAALERRLAEPHRRHHERREEPLSVEARRARRERRRRELFRRRGPAREAGREGVRLRGIAVEPARRVPLHHAMGHRREAEHERQQCHERPRRSGLLRCLLGHATLDDESPEMTSPSGRPGATARGRLATARLLELRGSAGGPLLELASGSARTSRR